MTMPEIICKSVAMQNNSQGPCSMCPTPELRHPIYIYFFFLVFPGHPEFWTTLQILLWGGPLPAPSYNASLGLSHFIKVFHNNIVCFTLI